MHQIITFMIDEQWYGIDVLLVREVAKLESTTSIPETPEFIQGLMNLRGQIITVIDTGVFVKRQMEPYEGRNDLLILKSREDLALSAHGEKAIEVGIDPVAIMVDSVGDVVEVEGLFFGQATRERCRSRA